MVHQLERVAPLQRQERKDGPKLDEEVADEVEAVQQLILVRLPGQLPRCLCHLKHEN